MDYQMEYNYGRMTSEHRQSSKTQIKEGQPFFKEVKAKK